MFQELNKLIADGQSLNFVVTKKGDSLTVSVLPQANNLKDEAKNKISPLVLTGSPEDLDNEFISTISEPLQKASGLLLNMETFEQQLSESQKSSKAAEQANKAEKEKKEKIDKLVKKAEQLEKEGKLPEAVGEYKKVLDIDKNHTKTQKKISELESKLGVGTLFADPVSDNTDDEENEIPDVEFEKEQDEDEENEDEFNEEEE